MCRKSIPFLISILVLSLTAGSVSAGVLQDGFEGAAIDTNKWQLLNGPDVNITQAGGQVFFDRPQTQLNYLVTAEQYDPAVTPLTIIGSATTGPEGLAIWTRASNTGNTNGPAHVLDNGIRCPLWPEGEANGWYDAEIIRKDPNVWGWTGIAADNIPGEKAYDWDFVLTDDGTTITVTWTQTSNPANTFTVTATDTAHFDTNYVAFTVVNGYLNDVMIITGTPVVKDDFEGAAIDLNSWQLLNGPDVSITQAGGQVFFDRPQTQLNYLLTAEQYDPAVTPLTIIGSATTGNEGLAIWTRASNTGNTNGPAHVLDNGIRCPLWPEGEANGWYDAEIIRKDPNVWGWTGIAADNIPGEKAYDWDFVLTDDGTTITVTWTQSSDPTNTFTVTATDTAHFDTNYVAFTVVNGYLNDVAIYTEKPQVGFSDDFETARDYLTEGLGAYDGMLNGTIEVLDANISRPGALYMQSANAIWDPGPGPLLYKEVTGDFIATVKVTDFAGDANNLVYNNDSGILARDPASDADDGVENWVAMNYFPTWTAFNVRSTVDGVRGEYGQPAGSWLGTDTFALAEQYPYIQLERKGSDFYFRISEDGVNFIPLAAEAYTGIYGSDPNQTPLIISRPDLPGKLQVGLMHCTYAEASGYVAYDDFGIELPIKPVDPGTEGLMAYYQLDNDLIDASGNGHDGTANGDPNFVEGVVGMGLEFDGVDDYVDTGYAEDLANWTISAWVKSPMAPSGDAGQSGPVHREANYQMNWNHGSESWRGAVGMSAGGWYSASLGPLEADTWYQLVGTYDGEDLKAYKDGALITTNDAPSGPAGAESNSLKLGKHARDAYFFTGTVDEVRIYNRALSEAEILYLASE